MLLYQHIVYLLLFIVFILYLFIFIENLIYSYSCILNLSKFSFEGKACYI